MKSEIVNQRFTELKEGQEEWAEFWNDIRLIVQSTKNADSVAAKIRFDTAENELSEVEMLMEV